jgi:hypothetical protein
MANDLINHAHVIKFLYKPQKDRIQSFQVGKIERSMENGTHGESMEALCTFPHTLFCTSLPCG